MVGTGPWNQAPRCTSSRDLPSLPSSSGYLWGSLPGAAGGCRYSRALVPSELLNLSLAKVLSSPDPCPGSHK